MFSELEVQDHFEELGEQDLFIVLADLEQEEFLPGEFLVLDLVVLLELFDLLHIIGVHLRVDHLAHDLALNLLEVALVIHLFQDLLPVVLVYLPRGYLSGLPQHALIIPILMLLFNKAFEEGEDGFLDSVLDEPELLVALVPEYLAEQGDVMVFLLVLLDAADDGGGPLNGEALEAVPLIEVGVHVLLHGLPGLLPLLALDVELLLLEVDVLD
mmetsp:Transcript_5215/g.4799  ORF Transcript_5215/g.4799 Transcript_5215/m.4799 type:complete len:213 (-) Transcript_5215:250-888(-)